MKEAQKQKDKLQELIGGGLLVLEEEGGGDEIL